MRPPLPAFHSASLRAHPELGGSSLASADFLAHQIFRDHCLSFMPVPQCSADGAGTLDLDELGRILWRSAYLSTADNQPAPKLLYCVPTGNNPTGRTMPDADRERLVALCAPLSTIVHHPPPPSTNLHHPLYHPPPPSPRCAEHNVRIVADDVYELGLLQ